MSDSSVFPHISIPTPNGEVYKRPQPTAPNHTYDAETISELSTFESKGISYQASRGNHDDLVMNLVLF